MKKITTKKIINNFKSLSSHNFLGFCGKGAGYIVLEINGVPRSYSISHITLEFKDTDNCSCRALISGEIDDIIEKECELTSIVQMIAYSNALKRYSGLVNKINNKRKELENLEKAIELKKELLRKECEHEMAAFLTYAPKRKSTYTTFDKIE